MPNLPQHYRLFSPGKNLETINFLALAGSISIVLVSIAASQILLGVTIFGVVWLWRRNSNGLAFAPSGDSAYPAGGQGLPLLPLPILWPIVAIFAWTIVAVLGNGPSISGFAIFKKFYLYSIIFVIPLALHRPENIQSVYRWVFAVSAVSSTAGVLQFAIEPDRDLLHRISGFMSQWMTYSGLLMLVLVALSAYAMSIGWRRHKWVIPLGLILATSLYLSETRNAWLGAVSGLAVVLLLTRPRALALLIVLMGVLYAASPAGIKQRFRSGFDVQDPNTRNRIELFETALKLVRDNPWLGVGPANVNREALRYRGTYEYPDWMYQHMHNNFLQIAAERGIPGLLFWLWFMGRLGWDAILLFRISRGDAGGDPDKRAQARMVSTAALGACAALLTSGMFEYNFGDSEVLTLFLFIAGAPYAFPRE